MYGSLFPKILIEIPDRRTLTRTQTFRRKFHRYFFDLEIVNPPNNRNNRTNPTFHLFVNFGKICWSRKSRSWTSWYTFLLSASIAATKRSVRGDNQTSLRRLTKPASQTISQRAAETQRVIIYAFTQGTNQLGKEEENVMSDRVALEVVVALDVVGSCIWRTQ